MKETQNNLLNNIYLKDGLISKLQSHLEKIQKDINKICYDEEIVFEIKKGWGGLENVI